MPPRRNARAAAFPFLVLGLTLGSATAARALDPEREIAQYALTKWAGSLPGPGIHALVQTPDHYLWLGTSAGLVRFDGAGFKLYDASTTPGFGEGSVARVVVDREGALFYGTSSGDVVRVKDGRFSPLAHSSGPGVVCAMLAARDGSLWFSLYGRPLQHWTPAGTASLADKVGSLGPLALVENGEGTVWIGTEHDGLVEAAQETFTARAVTRESIQSLHSDRSGALWLGTPHGLFRLRPPDHGSSEKAAPRLERFGRTEGLSHEDITAILEDRHGNLWVGTAGGVNRLTRGRWTSFTTAEGLSDDDVRSLLEDDEGNIWVGTADGLNCLSDTRFATYGRTEGLRDPAVSALTRSAAGGVWVGTAKGTVFRIRDGRAETFVLPVRPGRENVIALYETRDGSLWAALGNHRLFRLQGGTATECTPAPTTPPLRVTAISEDEQGPLFYVQGLGLARLDGGRMTPAAPHVPLLGYVHSIHHGRDGTLWLAASLGLTRVRGKDVKTFTVADGLPKDRVRWISEDAGGRLWLATAGGLALFDNDRARALTVAQGLPESYLRLVLDDGLGFLWVASMSRIFRLSKQEIEDVMAGRRDRVFPILFDTADGLRTTESVLGNSPGLRESGGRLWFATTRGASAIDPAHLAVDAPAPAVRIERLVVDDVAVVPARGEVRRFDPGRGQVTIDYSALRFRAASRVRFRYRLKGLDEDWAEAGSLRSAYYSNLPPGEYVFSVTACNPDGLWNGGVSELGFVILPPFHRTAPFYAAVAAAAGLILSLAHRLRLNQVRARFSAVIGERTRIARELHDTLAQGLAGTGIQLDAAMIVLPQKPDAAREHVALGRAMIRSTLGEVRRSIWVLRAQASKNAGDGFAAMLKESLEQLAEPPGLVPEIHVSGAPRELPAEMERNLLRIAHEAVTNAIRHSQAATLAVHLDFAADAVHLRVKDDGCGFDPTPWLVRHRGEHFGLVGLAERVRGLDGELRVESRVGEGTEVACRLPYRPPRTPAAGDGAEEVMP